MILAAGLGSRLKPHTDSIPKALVSIAGRPMLLWVAEKLMAAGARKIVVNAHHHAGQLVRFIGELDYPGIEFIVSDETDQLLDTGGGIMRARKLLEGEKAFIVYNTDVISDINLAAMLDAHKKAEALVTLAVTPRKSTRYFLWNNNRLCGWRNEQTGAGIPCKSVLPSTHKAMAFSGIHIIDPQIFSLTSRSGRFSINELYLELANSYHILPFEHDEKSWADTGTPEKLKQAEQMLQSNRTKFM